jgi:hypothetical protein
MSDIGAALRDARMRAGLDISAIEDRTKIRAKYLRALENEEWHLLPGATFTKGFLRSYADLVGLDGRALVEEFKAQVEVPGEPDVHPHPPAGSARRRGERPGPPPRQWSRLTVAAVVLAVIIIGLFLIGESGGGGAKHKGGGAHKKASAGATGATSALPNPCRAGASTALDCVRLAVAPTAPVFVCLIGDDGLVRIDGLTLGSDAPEARVTYHAEHFTLTLGSHAAKVLLNGTPLSLGSGTGAVRLALSINGAKALATPKRLSCK